MLLRLVKEMKTMNVKTLVEVLHSKEIQDFITERV